MQDKKGKNDKGRYVLLYALVIAVSALILHRLFTLQIVNGKDYRVISDSRLERSIPIKAPRGEILDRYARPLVQNRTGYSVAVSKIDDNKAAMNAMLLRLAALAVEHELDYKDELPISENEPYGFTIEYKTEEERLEQEAKFRVAGGFDGSMSAADIIAKYVKKYAVSDSYSAEEMRTIAGFRYSMERRSFSSSNSYIFAKDVDINLVTQLKEQKERFPYVTVYEESVREYADSTVASHILGRIGIINPEEYAQLKSKGYGMNDYLGKQGAEKAFEKYLKGTDGANSLERKLNNGRSELVYSKDPVPGNSVMLTIDLDLQRAAEQSLEKNINYISRTSRAGAGRDANAGAAVVIDVNSGEVLAMASYPTYDLTEFNEKYERLASDGTKPMLNRAINGVYEPGSTFKPVTAIAALEEGFTTPSERIKDEGLYHYLGHDFACWIYRSSHGTHGYQNVSQAIENSCNYYFYEMGKRMGIEALDKYASMLGLGDYTGIELEGEESKGQIASPELRRAAKREWYPGDVLQAAIGQSDNLFTPIQLANYTATLANGGKLYRAHILKSVKSNVTNEITEAAEPQVRSDIQLKEETYKAVIGGMKLVASDGTAREMFASFPVKTAGKTGSAQVASGSSNGLYIGFGPSENPQIAVAVVVEHGGSGGNASRIGRDIFEQYFFGKGETSGTQEAPRGELLR